MSKRKLYCKGDTNDDTETKLSACRRGLASLCQLLGYDSYVAWDKRRESVKASVMYSVSLLSKAAQIIYDRLIY